MLARILSAAVNGIEAFPFEVEVNCGWGDTIIVIVGLPDVVGKLSRALRQHQEAVETLGGGGGGIARAGGGAGCGEGVAHIGPCGGA